jgi:hypothetical protein
MGGLAEDMKMATTTTVIATEFPKAADLLTSAIKAAGGTITSEPTNNPIHFNMERPKKNWFEGPMAYRGTAKFAATGDRQTRVDVSVRLPAKTMAMFAIGLLGCSALAYMGFAWGWDQLSSKSVMYAALVPFFLGCIYLVAGPWAAEMAHSVIARLPSASLNPATATAPLPPASTQLAA